MSLAFRRSSDEERESSTIKLQIMAGGSFRKARSLALILAVMAAQPGETSPLSKEQLIRSAQSGDREAAFVLGRAYKLGDGVPLDTSEAARWLTKAAQLGHERAGAELGLVLYQDGKGQEALPWLRPAAERGDARAQYALGTIYFAGKIVPGDPAQARLWMTRAAKSGLPAAIEALAVMKSASAAEPEVRRPYEIVTVAPVKPGVPKPAIQVDSVRSSWQVQLGAFSVPANAQRMWRTIKGETQAQLHASFPKDGALTRLRIEPFPSRTAARRFCAEQRRRNRDCLEVRRRG
ncbi:SPOR domain-containing protein [Sphingomonas sp.]|uniref:SPOR domain-containing protein n=1 Tax=Sphingomonas sp. TaxID=28214 RepID=UPI002DF4E062|nr:SPOR domain-containing protein [Sphingomonas sp.]HEV2568358.1 SPOR domain-containing protein [Sphingomonas sp.]